MVGLLVLVCRTHIPITIIKQLYGSKKVNIPKAPGIGLMLRKLNFDEYNKKVQWSNQPSLKRKHKRKKCAHQEAVGQATIWDSIHCDQFKALFEHFKMQTLAQKTLGDNSNLQLPSSTQPCKPITASNVDTDNDEDEGGNMDKDNGDVVPVDKLNGQDPFGMLMNYLDAITGSDLEFLLLFSLTGCVEKMTQ
ncbi:hypothetical protein PCANC_20048 [Puccinia coronata f. sp. avenae]|uniref:Uncharacterized protein n=1 Tax=Puccinia coronata f. sp. avenae TaxID=200324 RepID=A0A2N5T165_9BASI|nr:hypothetical protein PCANC_20048 [Puccinia coronata f. sp. avenae]